MQAVIRTLWRGFAALYEFLADLIGGMFGAMWSAVMWLVGWATSWMLEFWTWQIEVLIGVVEWGLLFLPEAVELPAAVEPSNWDVANTYMPLNETAALIGVWVAVYGGVFGYKIFKAIRGGG